MTKDHNKEIQKMYTRYNVEPHCRCCGRPYIFGIEGDSRLICPTTGRGDDTLLHLRREVENKQHVKVTVGEPITPIQYVSKMSLFNEETIKTYLWFFIKQKSFRYTDKDIKKMRVYVAELISYLPHQITNHKWDWEITVDKGAQTVEVTISLAD